MSSARSVTRAAPKTDQGRLKTMRWPAEWEPHGAVWIGFPGDPAQWPVGLEDAQLEVAAFANAVCDNGDGETVFLVCRDQYDADIARRLVHHRTEIIVEPFGDIWLRDTGPIVTVTNGSLHANNFRFNGWGGKYEMPGDQEIGVRLAAQIKIPHIDHEWILEGGAIDTDGAGRCITTAQCVLHSNRNQGMTRYQIEHELRETLGITEICWLIEGLKGDHTDGHIDNLARFIGGDTVVIPVADTSDDPNEEVFEDAAQRAAEAGLNVVRLPSVGRFEIDSTVVPASYMNFYIGNNIVVVPQYEASNDAKAVAEIARLLPDRKVVGLSSKALLRGGGSFHCISQQIPRV
ncbi:Agmatine deiminase [hydrothermal vent metagenome]|uniref:Agmatine deiminase n=1 Tax=hydrothermal vent metagenome TaxID=652676 RepID=A0A3B0RZG5_9ZZZZ